MPSRRRTSADTVPGGRASAPDPVEDPDDWTPDSTPFVEGYDVAPDSVPAMVGVGVPAVVAVVSTRNPGPWLEPMLESLAAQEYANLTVLVVDAGSLVDPTERVAGVLPNAFVKRLDGATFAETANAALGTIEGAQFYLFCHDDIDLRAGAVQAMVEEAFRSNAGIVGAKLVDWDDPEHLRSVGGSVDKFGFSWPIAELNELDQAQHDAVREAFVVSSAAMLVRCDLFADLGGFSTDIDGSGEDLDLCWRARVAGARTVVMPAAVVRHRERSELGDPTGRAHRLALRHQARIMMVCYSPMQLLRIAPQAMLLAFVDMIGALVRGHAAVAGDVVSAFAWNVAHLPRTLRLRGRVKRSRRTPDEEIRRLQIKGSVRFISFVRRHTSGSRTVSATLARAARGLPGSGEDPAESLVGVVAFLVVAVVLAVGSRSLIGSGVPVVRDFAPLGSASRLFSEWWSGWRSVGLGSSGGAPTINVVGAVATWLTFGSAGFARTVLILAPLPLGAVASWRLLRGCASTGARSAALLAYLVNPVPYNAIAEGRWQALVVYAACPAILGRVARAGAWAPFDTAEPAPGSTQRQIVGLGIVLAAAATVAPVVLLVAVVICALVVATLTATARDGRPMRAITVTAGGLGVSFLLHLPWAVSVLASSNRWAILSGSDPSRRAPLALSRAVLFDSGSHGGLVTIGLMVASVVALMISSQQRFRWATLAAVLILTSFTAIVLAGRLAPGVSLPAPEVLLSLAGVGVVLSLALGVEAFRSDVVGGAFGWRQLLSLLAVLSVVVSSVPLVLDFLDGRWLAPVSDTATALRPITPRSSVANERTLWVGDAEAMSLSGWALRDGMKFALTDGVGPGVSSLFPPEMGAGERSLRALLNDATVGGTGRLGASLAPFGVRYVVVQQRLAPLPYGRTLYSIDPELEDRLNQQLDLARIEVAPGIEVYENLARLPIRFTADPGTAATWAKPGGADALVADPPTVSAWSVTGRPPTAYRGKLPNDEALVDLSTRDANWTLSVDGRDQQARPVFGWASQFRTGAGGDATLEYSTPAWQILAHVLQLLVLVSLPWTRRRRVHEFRVRLAHSRSERSNA
ncbi:MAG: glycosyltransferase family 2 protein [Acidimicrobiales bacterium]